MPRRLLHLVTRRRSPPALGSLASHTFSVEDVVWAMGSFCALNRKPFDPELLVRQFPPPYSADSLIHAARALGFRIRRKECAADTVALTSFHLAGSDTAALGGDLAYQYGELGALSGIGLTAGQQLLGSGQLGTGAQSLQAPTTLQQGAVRLG